MELTDVQKQEIARWVVDGMGLSDIQKRINGEFKIPMTFMDVRLLVIDIGAEYEEPEPEEKPAPAEDAGSEGDDTMADEKQSAPEQNDEVSVEIDAITRPGVLISGSVMFTDGVKATWGLDQTGRIALNAGQPDYKPSDQDLKLFQLKLRETLQKKGF